MWRLKGAQNPGLAPSGAAPRLRGRMAPKIRVWIMRVLAILLALALFWPLAIYLLWRWGAPSETGLPGEAEQ